MKEIGGYFELECGHSICPREGAFLNSGSSAWKYVLQALRISRIWVPYYTCKCIAREARKVGCEVMQYEIDDNFMPVKSMPVTDFVLYNNYFGVCGQKVEQLATKYPKLIVDNAQAFYSKPRGLASFCSPHKFFGVPDGGIASLCNDSSVCKMSDLDIDHSVARMGSLLKRLDYDAGSGYSEYRASLDELAVAPILRMSNLTKALLGNIDYGKVAEQRLSNFNFLHSRLHSEFPFAMADDDIPMVYPYVTDDSGLRARLIQQKIYVATYWPGVSNCGDLQERILPLPIDQRYGLEDMGRICDSMAASAG